MGARSGCPIGDGLGIHRYSARYGIPPILVVPVRTGYPIRSPALVRRLSPEYFP